VKIHRNAKTTPSMRALIVERVRRDHWRVADAAAAAGVTRRTAAKWLARYSAGGRLALEDRSSRPHRSPRQTSATHIARIVALRHERLTAWRIAVRVQLPRSTVARVLVRTGLNRLTRLAPVAPVQRYEYSAPGGLVHLDIKPLARILRVGHRIHGDRRAIVKGAGWEYVHVAVDDHSRVAYVEVLPDQRGRTTAHILCGAQSAGLRSAGSRSNGCSPTTAARTAPTSFASWPIARAFGPAVSALSATDQRQSGTLHSNAAARVGVRDGLPDLVASHPGAASVASPLQHRATAYRHWLSATVLPFSEGSSMNNLVGNHN
jgi:transposase